MPDSATQIFLAHRNLLFTIAYQMLGSAADAEDVLQETWLRWVKVDQPQVVDQRAFLVRITTRLSLDRLRALKRRKEYYIGPWLPEPLLTTPDVADDVELANRSFLCRLRRDRCNGRQDPRRCPPDRASRSETRRARRPRAVVSPRDARAAVESIRRALETGDFESLLKVLAPDVVLVTDGGGIRQAALRPIAGAEKVVRFVTGSIHKTGVSVAADRTVINGNPALLLSVDGHLDGVLATRVEHGRVTGLYYICNPEKLSRVSSQTALTRR